MGFKEKAVIIPLALCAIAIFGFGIYNTACKHSFFSFIASSSTVNLDVIVSGAGCVDGVQFMMFGEPNGGTACQSNSIVDYGVSIKE